jgi:hypothetical protein
MAKRKILPSAADRPGRHLYHLDILGPNTADVPKKWEPSSRKPRPVVGQKDPFVTETVEAFARGEIDRNELSYRLRTRHVSKRYENRR